MAWYPRATRREVTKHRTPMAAHRRLILHTAVSSASSLFGWHQQVNHGSHFYLRADGTWEQYVDTRFRAPNQMDGNHDSVSVESQDMGGPFPAWSGSNVPAWTDAQTESIAELAVWLHETHGIPLVQLPSSRPGTRGIGWHRQGVDGNFPDGILAGRVSGGETWSNPGKVCPGDRRIRQVPGIIARAVALAEDDVSAEDVWSHRWEKVHIPGTDTSAAGAVRWIHKHVSDLVEGQAELRALVASLAGQDPVEAFRAELAAHRAELVAELADDLAGELSEVPADQVEAAVARVLSRTTLAVGEPGDG